MKLKEIMDNKNYTEFFEDEKELLWKLRAEVRDHYPESLSKLLLITKWNKREDVLQVKTDTCNFNSDFSSSVNTLWICLKSTFCLLLKKKQKTKLDSQCFSRLDLFIVTTGLHVCVHAAAAILRASNILTNQPTNNLLTLFRW